MRVRTTLPAAGLLLAASLGGATGAGAQAPARPAAKAKPAPHVHGTPSGWTFRWPAGDAARGREVFVKLECFSCHEVRGETFPAPTDAEGVGPELSMMGPLHPPEFFAEALINPSASIEGGKGYAAADGSSKMPSYNDAVTVQEIVDLVAYLRQLRPPGTGTRGTAAPSSRGKPAAPAAGQHH